MGVIGWGTLGDLNSDIVHLLKPEMPDYQEPNPTHYYQPHLHVNG